MPLDSQGNPRSGYGRLGAAEESFKKKKSAGSPGKGLGKIGGQKSAASEQAVSAAGGGHSAAGEEHMHAHSHKGGEHDVSHMDMGDVVKEHGPATKIFSEHDHDGGSHHVHSVHGEKHHHTDHDSAQAAHEHLAHSMGVGEEDTETAGKKAEPFAGEETPDEEAAEEETGIPGLTSS